jgi:alpha-glucuronidase
LRCITRKFDKLNEIIKKGKRVIDLSVIHMYNLGLLIEKYLRNNYIELEYLLSETKINDLEKIKDIFNKCKINGFIKNNFGASDIAVNLGNKKILNRMNENYLNYWKKWLNNEMKQRLNFDYVDEDIYNDISYIKEPNIIRIDIFTKRIGSLAILDSNSV